MAGGWVGHRVLRLYPRRARPRQARVRRTKQQRV